MSTHEQMAATYIGMLGGTYAVVCYLIASATSYGILAAVTAIALVVQSGRNAINSL